MYTSQATLLARPPALHWHLSRARGDFQQTFSKCVVSFQPALLPFSARPLKASFERTSQFREENVFYGEKTSCEKTADHCRYLDPDAGRLLRGRTCSVLGSCGQSGETWPARDSWTSQRGQGHGDRHQRCRKHHQGHGSGFATKLPEKPCCHHHDHGEHDLCP